MVSRNVSSLALLLTGLHLLPAPQGGAMQAFSPPHSQTASISTLQFRDMVSKLRSRVYYTIVSSIK